jgi:hypothetical protein
VDLLEESTVGFGSSFSVGCVDRVGLFVTV